MECFNDAFRETLLLCQRVHIEGPLWKRMKKQTRWLTAAIMYCHLLTCACIWTIGTLRTYLCLKAATSLWRQDRSQMGGAQSRRSEELWGRVVRTRDRAASGPGASQKGLSVYSPSCLQLLHSLRWHSHRSSLLRYSRGWPTCFRKKKGSGGAGTPR